MECNGRGKIAGIIFGLIMAAGVIYALVVLLPEVG